MPNTARRSIRSLFDAYVATLALLVLAGAAWRSDITLLLAGA